MPRYKVYFAPDLVADAELDMVTYEGGDIIMKKLSVRPRYSAAVS